MSIHFLLIFISVLVRVILELQGKINFILVQLMFILFHVTKMYLMVLVLTIITLIQ